MIGKLLFTAAVIAVVVMLVRVRRRPVARIAGGGGRAIPARPLFRWLAAAVVVVMLAGTVVYLYLDWRAASEILQVRVIDARSGQVSSYSAYRGDIGERSFRAVDGRLVTLAETERMETELPERR